MGGVIQEIEADLVAPNGGYELSRCDYDMTVRLIKDGTELVRVSDFEMMDLRRPGDTPEVTFCRVLAARRAGLKVIANG